MKIPKNLPQFERLPALFVASGEFAAKFYLASNGEIKIVDEINAPPRLEAKEKQGFIGRSEAPAGFGAVSHKGRYIEDLKRKFTRRLEKTIRSLQTRYQLREIHIFAPKSVSSRLMRKMGKDEKKYIKMLVNKELTKANPLELIKTLASQEREMLKIQSKARKEAEKILAKTQNR